MRKNTLFWHQFIISLSGVPFVDASSPSKDQTTEQRDAFSKASWRACGPFSPGKKRKDSIMKKSRMVLFIFYAWREKPLAFACCLLSDANLMNRAKPLV